MSSTYNLEPPPTAKVLLQTSAGDILLELFAKQAPLASRNFLQLCLDGYYNGTIFHRLVPGFIIQGGDPTGTGQGGEAIYDDGPFADEFHSRLKFNRRGLLGMANSGRKDDNGSQFFLTLGKTEELDGKNTMFGRVVGDTIYNLMKMGEAELTAPDDSERPLYPTTITGAEILVNPFEAMVKKENKMKTMPSTERVPGKKKTKKKAALTLLSFGDDEGNQPEEPVPKKARFNTNLVSAGDAANGADMLVREAAAKKSFRPIRKRDSVSPDPVVKLNTNRETQLPLPNDEKASRSPSSSPEPVQVKKVSSMLERTNAQIAELKASMKRTVTSAVPSAPRKRSALEQMVPENSMRGRKRKHGHPDSSTNDLQALKTLNAFRAKLDEAPAIAPPQTQASDPPTGGLKGEDLNRETGQGDDEEAHLCDLHFIANCESCQAWNRQAGEEVEAEDDNDKGWMSHALNFGKDRLGKDLSWKRKNEAELVVIDPREKAKDIKEEQRAAQRSAKGLTGKGWDKDRDRGRLPERLAGARR